MQTKIKPSDLRIRSGTKLSPGVMDALDELRDLIQRRYGTGSLGRPFALNWAIMREVAERQKGRNPPGEPPDEPRTIQTPTCLTAETTAWLDILARQDAHEWDRPRNLSATLESLIPRALADYRAELDVANCHAQKLKADLTEV